MNQRTKVALQALGIAAVLTLGMVATTAAEARPRGRVHLGLWVGGPLWWGPMPYGYGYPYVVERPVIVHPPAEPVVVAPAQQSHSWYYCRDAQMYYPYVTSCPSAWQEVPATPAPAAAAEAPATPAAPASRTGTPVPAARSN
jgi:hypothetical protein